MFPSPYGVSFILIKFKSNSIEVKLLGFRLLTEYHSFLFEKICYNTIRELGREVCVSVSLRSIIHSYNLTFKLYPFTSITFPSPYGVSFILIRHRQRVII